MGIKLSKKDTNFINKSKRYREIISTIIAFGFSDIVDQSPVLRKLHTIQSVVKKYKGHKLTEYTHNQRIRMLLEALGPTFIKLGQILSNRHDILSKDLINELSLLQSNVPPFSPEVAKEIVERSLGDKTENLFEYFEYESKFSASISQMHRARLLDGTEVAVKVQRPNIEKTINLDIEILFDIAQQLQKHVSSISMFNPVGIVEAFKHQIKNELDFGYEKGNLKRFAKFFENEPTVHIPAIYERYCNKQILTMEFIDAVKISDVNKEEYNFDNDLVLDRLANAMFEQVFHLNCFHADPHPGNVFVKDDNIISFIDFGMVGIITPNIKKPLAEMVHGMYSENYTKLAKGILGLTVSKKVSNFDDFSNSVYQFIQKFVNMSMEELNLEEVFNEIISIINKNNLTLNSDVSLMFKTIVILEGVCRKVNPNFVLMTKIHPLMKNYIKEQFSRKSISKQAQAAAMDMHDIISNLPKTFHNIMSMVEDGTLEIKFHHKGIDKITNTINSAVNKLSFSLILASIIIASAFIIHANVAPFVGEVSLIGFIGICIAGLMGLILLFGYIKNYFKKKR